MYVAFIQLVEDKPLVVFMKGEPSSPMVREKECCNVVILT